MPSPPVPIPELPPQALRQRLDAGEALTLLDVREPRERSFCAIAAPATAGDLHIPMREVPARLADIQDALPAAPWSFTATTASARWPWPNGSPTGIRARSSTSAGASTPGPWRSIPRSGDTDGFRRDRATMDETDPTSEELLVVGGNERQRATHWRGRRRRVIAGAALACLLTGIAATSLIGDFLADRRYREAVANADRLDPGWRADALVSRLEPIPDAENSALGVLDIATELVDMPDPASKNYQPLWVIWQSDPALRLSVEQVAALRAQIEPFREPLARARTLAAMPKGRYPEARPVVSTLERVPNSNILRTAPSQMREEAALRLFDLISRGIILLAEEGDADGALELTRAMLNVGRSFGDEPSRMGQRVREAVTGLARGRLERSPRPGRGRRTFAGIVPGPAGRRGDPRRAAVRALRGERAALDELFGKVVAGELPRSAIRGHRSFRWSAGSSWIAELCVRIRSGCSRH